MQTIDEDEVESPGEGQTDETEVDEGFDVQDEETQVWLHRIGLYNFAQLPWAAWQQNAFVEQQMMHLRENRGYITDETEVTPQLVAQTGVQIAKSAGVKVEEDLGCYYEGGVWTARGHPVLLHGVECG